MNKPECKTNSYGTKRWFLNGSLHREDGPAIEYADGDKSWFLNNKLHRKDGPASEFANGTKQWFLNGKLHREDGPAIEWTSGSKEWFLNNEEVHPETIVDLWLSRGVFCWHDETNDCLDFGEKNGQT
jgi:hypothetical protein